MNEENHGNEQIHQFPNDINNINNNLINNNNNNNINNINNSNNSLINLTNQNNNNYYKKYSKITFSFTIILFINILIEIYSFFQNINSRKYVFQFAPIYEKNQYYRFVTNYFIHYGIGHEIVELYITYKICYLIENILGTIITISFIMISMIMNSILNFFIVKLMVYIQNLMHALTDLNYDYESGMTSVLFTLITFYYTFKDLKKKKINILSTFDITGKYISLAAFFSIYCFTPNKAFFSNLSGIINGYIFKFLNFLFFPKVNWVRDFEHYFPYKCKKFDNIYRNINIKNNLMVNALNELQKNSMIKIKDNIFKNNNIIDNYNYNYNYGNDFNINNRQMSELSNYINNGSDEGIRNNY